ncbi:MAG: hypothetical protein IJ542_00765 [Clostridia bacterium]|nr:hypothetical protein [Clostridia bacterium]
MKKLKQIIVSIALVFAMVVPAFALVACGNKNSSNNNQEQAEAVTLSSALASYQKALAGDEEEKNELRAEYNEKQRDFAEYNATQNALNNNPEDAQERLLNARLEELEDKYETTDTNTMEDIMAAWETEKAEIEAQLLPEEAGDEGLVLQYQDGYQHTVAMSLGALAYLNAAGAKENIPYTFEINEIETYVAEYAISGNKINILLDMGEKGGIAAFQLTFNGGAIQTVEMASCVNEVNVKTMTGEIQLEGEAEKYEQTYSRTNIVEMYVDFASHTFYGVLLREEYTNDSRYPENDYVPVLPDFVAAYNAGNISQSNLNKLYDSNAYVYLAQYNFVTGDAKEFNKKSVGGNILSLLKPVKGAIATLPTKTTEFEYNLLEVEEVSAEAAAQAEVEIAKANGDNTLELLDTVAYNEETGVEFNYNFIAAPAADLTKAQMLSILDQLVDMIDHNEYNSPDWFEEICFLMSHDGSTYNDRGVPTGLNYARKNLANSDEWNNEIWPYDPNAEAGEAIVDSVTIITLGYVNEMQLIKAEGRQGYPGNFYFAIDGQGQVVLTTNLLNQYTLK